MSLSFHALTSAFRSSAVAGVLRTPSARVVTAVVLALGLSATTGLPLARAGADLVPLSVDASAVWWQEGPNRARGPVVAQVRNRGDLAVGAAFAILFFEDRDHDGAYDPGNDLNLGIEPVASLGAGATTTVSRMLDAGLAFRGSPIWVEVNYGHAVAEDDVTNNRRRSGLDCLLPPSSATIDPALEWSWQIPVDDPFPASLNVITTPVVVDLDGDGRPEVIVSATASTAGSTVQSGVLRVLDGSDGSLHFNVADPALRVNAVSGIAAGDVDGDGRPEILAADSTGTGLLCLEHDGAFKWRRSGLEAIAWGAPALADLDGDGVAEILVGRQVLDAADGSLRWTGAGGRGAQSDALGGLSHVADVDLDGDPEVVAGNTVYRGDGSILHQNAAITDALTAIADLDGDPYPEIVHVGVFAGTQIRVLDHTLAVQAGPFGLPTGSGAGPPCLADFDGDGAVEIVVAGTTRLCMFEADGTLRWQATIKDLSSGRTGVAACDFDQDGAADIVYRSEDSLRIVRGADGVTVWATLLGSCTWYEHPIVADVDADGSAEIVVGANTNCSNLGNTQQGVRVFGSAGGRWLGARRIWNQFAYDVTSVLEDGRIPDPAPVSWRYPSEHPVNRFRAAAGEPGLPVDGAPDATASHLGVVCDGGGYVLSVRVGNAGAAVLPSGLAVTFYRGNPEAGGALVGATATTHAIGPGRYEVVSLPVAATFGAAATHHVIVASASGECDTENQRGSRPLGCPTTAVTPLGAESTRLGTIAPNPFATGTVIGFTLASAGRAELDVYDVRGRRVASILDRALAAGAHVARWNGADDSGRRVPAGIYFCRFAAGGRILMRRMVRLGGEE